MANPNGNVQNLDPVRSKEEAKKRGKNGGVQSGKARRRKRAMKDATKLLLDMPIQQDSIANAMRTMGIDEKDLTNQMAMLVSMWKEAMSGNVAAAVFLRDTAGEDADHKLKQDEFEYKKERDAGISQEIEDMDEIEGEIYGETKQVKNGEENQEDRPDSKEDD